MRRDTRCISIGISNRKEYHCLQILAQHPLRDVFLIFRLLPTFVCCSCITSFSSCLAETFSVPKSTQPSSIVVTIMLSNDRLGYSYYEGHWTTRLFGSHRLLGGCKLHEMCCKLHKMRRSTPTTPSSCAVAPTQQTCAATLQPHSGHQLTPARTYPLAFALSGTKRRSQRLIHMRPGHCAGTEKVAFEADDHCQRRATSTLHKLLV